MIIEKKKLLSSLTSWKVGGPADILLIPENKEELIEAVKKAKDYNKFFIIGNGTNVLAKDEGFSYPLIKLGKGFGYYNREETLVRVGASASLISIANKTINDGLAGLEFASGIPGSLGGAIVMNAGAHGSEIKDILVEVLAFDTEKEEFIKISNKDMNFSYRNSFLKNNSRYIVVEALLELNQGSIDELKEKVQNYKAQRLERQPYEFPNAGSVFKNPEGMSAGKLIEDSGLKGYKVNGAEVSIKHGNFIINKNNATYNDIITIINHVEKIVNEKFNVKLEREIIILE